MIRIPIYRKLIRARRILVYTYIYDVHIQQNTYLYMNMHTYMMHIYNNVHMYICMNVYIYEYV